MLAALDAAALDVTIIRSLEGKYVVSFDEVPDEEGVGGLAMMEVPNTALNKRYTPPVFTDPNPDRPAIVHRLEFLGGAVQVAVMMPQGMEIEDLSVDLAETTPTIGGVGQASLASIHLAVTKSAMQRMTDARGRTVAQVAVEDHG